MPEQPAKCRSNGFARQATNRRRRRQPVPQPPANALPHRGRQARKPARACPPCSSGAKLDVLHPRAYPIIYVVTWEEERVERCLREIATARNKNFFVWTITQGIVSPGSEAQHTKSGSGNTSDPLAGSTR